jgi:hypothetical protein
MYPQLLEEVVSTLFPEQAEYQPPVMTLPSATTPTDGAVPEVTSGELSAAVDRMKTKNTAPGLDGVPGRAWALALGPLEMRLRTLYTQCLQRGTFPMPWKEGRLVLLRKEGRPPDSPSAYRPIVLLDEVGKLLERIIASRLNRHLEETGPNLSDRQYGFRRHRSTIDAILHVRSVSEEAISRGEVVLAVSLDIANAFNSLPWACIREALKYHNVPPYLSRVLADYLSGRPILFEGRSGWHSREICRAVFHRDRCLAHSCGTSDMTGCCVEPT